MSIFISRIKYKKHLITIPNNSRSSIILTGKNGSGKTQLLNAIKKQFLLIEKNHGLNKSKTRHSNISLKERLHLDYLKKQALFDLGLEDEIEEMLNIAENKNNNKRKKFVDLSFNSINNEGELKNRFNKGFIVAFFDAKRSLGFQKPTGITSTSSNRYSINDIAGTEFVQYLVNLKADRAFAFEEENEIKVRNIDRWFMKLEHSFRDLFETNNLELQFDRKNFTFHLIIDGKKLDFHNLSDGFSSIIFIVSEIIMRMGNKRRLMEEGIVIIDEIENHLHVSLQKKILRFLTNFFPNIQFIISTHSPFVLSSIEKAIIYDMETMKTSENFSRFSYESIVEDYFDVDLYSDLIKKHLDEYKSFVKRENNLTVDERFKLELLTNYLSNIPNNSAPELKSEFLNYEIERWNKP